MMMIGLGALGIWMLYTERKTICQAFAAYRWMTTEGIVVDMFDDSFTTSGIDRTSAGIVPVTYMETKHVYEYMVGGQVYRSSNFCFGGHVEQAEASFAVGAKVKVFYNPRDPQTAVLKRGVPGVAFIGVLLVGGGAFMGWKIFSGG